ncbi:type II secretion system protein [Catenovulum sediminis]|uniref:Type II secretion system protein n=1 Tax=Catenovulum sediminis TaxID=1740262 RepID=A0ABV1RD15_9ALTE|nr:type II secretion system protein [Catenovulum sediminis]
MRKCAAFTLIEMVTVIVVLSIVGVFMSRFMGWGAMYYVDVSERQLVLDDSRFIIERLTRELRTAVPYSLRVLNDNANNQSCIEFIPIVTSGRYINIPLAPASSTQLTLISPTNSNILAGQNISIYPTNSADIYDTSNNQTFTIDSVDAVAGDGSQVIHFASASSFASPSAAQRYYTWTNPVSYCLENTNIVRYQNYPASAVQNTRAQLQAINTTSSSLMAENVSNQVATEAPFHVTSDASLIRHAQIALYLEFSRLTDDNENMFFHHLVQIPNAP